MTEEKRGEATKEADSPGSPPAPVSKEHLLFALVGIFLGGILGYTLAFQIHSQGRPGFEPPSRPNVGAMEPGMGTAPAGGRPDFLNEDGSIDMDKVPAEIRDQMSQAKAVLDQHIQMLEEDPENVDLMLTIGRFYMNLGMVDKGMEYYERAVEKAPERADLRVEYGLASYDTGMYAQAVDSMKAALEISGDDPDTLTHLALAYLRMGEVDRSLEVLDKAAAADPQHAMSRFNRAVILLFAVKDADAAEQALQEAETLVPEGDHRIQMMSDAIERFRTTGELPELLD
jgi:tetratricopeptide (TPR) repeat protein